jgi:hypothetical protein
VCVLLAEMESVQFVTCCALWNFHQEILS